ncbi:unnamed protein product [Anisakis simplex]|uniref:Secreted protein n=1 Tax=Anisakis simplex TaxID=6269 RepID=A0A0M3JQ18_ANISI|nr:unnamed protein product [Anisakis simplex]
MVARSAMVYFAHAIAQKHAITRTVRHGTCARVQFARLKVCDFCDQFGDDRNGVIDCNGVDWGEEAASRGASLRFTKVLSAASFFRHFVRRFWNQTWNSS